MYSTSYGKKRETRQKIVSPLQSHNSIDHYLQHQNTVKNMVINESNQDDNTHTDQSGKMQQQLYCQERNPLNKKASNHNKIQYNIHSCITDHPNGPKITSKDRGYTTNSINSCLKDSPRKKENRLKTTKEVGWGITVSKEPHKKSNNNEYFNLMHSKEKEKTKLENFISQIKPKRHTGKMHNSNSTKQIQDNNSQNVFKNSFENNMGHDSNINKPHSINMKFGNSVMETTANIRPILYNLYTKGINKKNSLKDKKTKSEHHLAQNHTKSIVNKKSSFNSIKNTIKTHNTTNSMKKSSNILIMNDSHFNPVSSKKNIERGVNIDLNPSDSERKSLCLKSIKINMKKSKINLELSSKPKNNEIPSCTTIVNTSVFTNPYQENTNVNTSKNPYYKNNKGHYINGNKQFLTRSHLEEFVNNSSFKSKDPRDKCKSKTNMHELSLNKNHKSDKDFFSNDKIRKMQMVEEKLIYNNYNSNSLMSRIN